MTKLSGDIITRQLEWIKSRNLGGNDQLMKMMTLIDTLEAENAQLKADLAQATQREARLWEVLREAVQCFCVTQKPADYPVDSWINKALTELRRPKEAGT